MSKKKREKKKWCDCADPKSSYGSYMSERRECMGDTKPKDVHCIKEIIERYEGYARSESRRDTIRQVSERVKKLSDNRNDSDDMDFEKQQSEIKNNVIMLTK